MFFSKGTNIIALSMFQSTYVLVFYHRIDILNLFLVSVKTLSGKCSSLSVKGFCVPFLSGKCKKNGLVIVLVSKHGFNTKSNEQVSLVLYFPGSLFPWFPYFLFLWLLPDSLVRVFLYPLFYGSLFHGFLVRWFPRSLVPLFDGFLVWWFHVSLVRWFPVPWLPCLMVSLFDGSMFQCNLVRWFPC